MKLVDTYAEAFEGLFIRCIITAKDGTRLKKAAYNSTALPSVVINRTEGGIERWLTSNETPDKRLGALVQFWGVYDRQNMEKSINRFYKEVSYRIRQGILVVPTTAVFNAYESTNTIDMMRRVGHCGDGYEWEEQFNDRTIIQIPLMMGDFRIERYMGYGLGVMGGNVWFMCKSEDAALKIGDKAVSAIEQVDNAITTFEICAAGSKPETNFPEIGPTTNHRYCPTLRNKIPDSLVPDSAHSIPEIVINGITLNAVKNAMKAAIVSVQENDGVIMITAGNYGGQLGKYKIFLRELFLEA
jgi:formylmethanofuran--tetrahydromethanopterin N-formyltransferase